MIKHYALSLLTLATIPTAWSQGFAELDISGTRARFYANGRVAYDTLTQQPHFEVPSGSGVDANYCGIPWIGAMNSSGQAQFSGSTYDMDAAMNFYPGPLMVDGTASTSISISQQFDHVWKIDRADVAVHLAYYDCLGDPNCDVSLAFPNGYTIPAEFLDWPAHGPSGYDLYLAPFYDYNMDGSYTPDDGDAPCILGDQALYYVFSDHLNLFTGNLPLGIEVQAMPFAYASGDPMLDQTVFVRFHLINRSTQTYAGTKLGFFNDYEIGCANDDFIGCDPSRSLSYAYNWQEVDSGCFGALGYGGPVPPNPAFGMVLLKGPLADADGSDGALSNELPNWNGQGFGDAIADNERHGMSTFLYFNRQGSNANMNDPTDVQQHYHYLNARWRNGVPMTYGGNGYSLDPNAVQCAFMYPGDGDPVGSGTGGIPQPAWSEIVPTPTLPDRRGIMSSGPITLEPGQHVDLLYAYVYARAASGGAVASVSALQDRVDSVRAFAQTLPIWNIAEEGAFGSGCLDYPFLGVNDAPEIGRIALFPSPASDHVAFDAPDALIGGRLTLRDATGRIVLQQRVLPGRNEIGVAGLANGVYTCEAVAARARFTGRVVKQ